MLRQVLTLGFGARSALAALLAVQVHQTLLKGQGG